MTRRGIGARALALIAVLIVLIAASILADRMGAPWPVTTATMIGVTVAGFAFAGLTSRTLRLSTFRLAGRRLGWSRGGSMMLVVALGLALLDGVRPTFVAQSALASAAGVLAFGVFFATPLRLAGAPGLGSFAFARYRSRALAALVGVATFVIGSALAITAAKPALAALATIPVLSPALSQAIFLVLLLVMLLPGGAASLGATAVVAAFLAVAAYGLPAATVLAGGEAAGAADALAQTGLALADVAAGGKAWLGVAWLGALTAAILALAGAGGVMRNAGLARQVSAGATLTALALIAAALTIFFAVERVTDALGDVPPQKLPALIYAERAQGLITVCGVAPGDPVAVERACRPLLVEGRVPSDEIRIAPGTFERWMAAALDLPMSLAALAMIAPAVLLTGLTAAALRFAVAGLLDDVLYRLGGFSGTASGRLALHRLVMGAAGVALTLGALPPVPPGVAPSLIFFTILLPAVLVLPGLSGRADWRMALMLLLVALGIAALLAFNIGLAISFWYWGLLLALVGAGLMVLMPSRDDADAQAAAVLRGEIPGPLMEGDA